MKIIGLTGGIGSGKSTVAKLFEKLKIPTYNSDIRAKVLMNKDIALKSKIIELLGSKAYGKNGLNRKWVASQVFDDKVVLTKLNALVHPVVREDFEKWISEQKTPYVLKEAAILIESGTYKDCDKIIVVTAQLPHRIKRVQKRDDSSIKEIEARIKNQIDEMERSKYADYIIKNNDGLEELECKVLQIHNKILKLKQ